MERFSSQAVNGRVMCSSECPPRLNGYCRAVVPILRRRWQEKIPLPLT